jgi:hypothetical protein
MSLSKRFSGEKIMRVNVGVLKIDESVSARLASLPKLPMAELWVLWDQNFNRRPNNTNRNYIESRLAYRFQELEFGGVPTAIRRQLVEAGAKLSKIKSNATSRSHFGRGVQVNLMPGTTLIRDWDDREYRVTVAADGRYELNGQTFTSLSAAAHHITGTKWNGPKFFGLRNAKGHPSCA